jgi:hypothetical protein
MKKLLILTVIFAGFMQTAKAQALFKNDVLFEAYYGYATPGIILAAINTLDGETNSNGKPYDPKTSVLGPIGLRVQYMASESFGIGLDVNFEQKTGTWQSASLTYDSDGFLVTDNNGDYVYADGEGKYQVTKLKVMVRGAWEFVNTDKFTMNWANSIGYKAGGRTLEDTAGDLGVSFSGNLVPVAIRSALGARFFFTENVALNAEVGLFGGGLLTGGITYKL